VGDAAALAAGQERSQRFKQLLLAGARSNSNTHDVGNHASAPVVDQIDARLLRQHDRITLLFDWIRGTCRIKFCLAAMAYGSALRVR
jgi:hypothetical protein